MYGDFPNAVSIFNHYRKQWCGAYWQDNGIDVIPTIGWVFEDSFQWCLDGIPHDSLICVSTVGAFADKSYRKGWVEGFHRCLDILTPKKVLFYGKLYPEIDIPDGIEYSVAVNQNTKTLSDIRDNKRKEKKKD